MYLNLDIGHFQNYIGQFDMMKLHLKPNKSKVAAEN